MQPHQAAFSIARGGLDRGVVAVPVEDVRQVQFHLRSAVQFADHDESVGRVDPGFVGQARACLRVFVPAAVEPDGAVERGFLVHQQVGEVVVERLAVVGGGEVAAVLAPPGDGLGDSGDKLLDAVLALVGARVPAEVLVGHDVGRLLGPVLRDIDAFLAEDGLAVRVLDRGRAGFPFDVVVDAARRDVLGERPGEGESGMFRRGCGAAVCSGLCHRFSRFPVRAGAERRAGV